MRIGIDVGDAMGPVSLDTIVSRMREAAAAGLSTAWMAQVFGWDALTALAVAGREAPGIALGTAIVQTYPRHPLALASQALSVQAATGNRLRLGIGPSHRFIIEGMFGYSFEKPAPGTCATICPRLPRSCVVRPSSIGGRPSKSRGRWACRAPRHRPCSSPRWGR